MEEQACVIGPNRGSDLFKILEWGSLLPFYNLNVAFLLCLSAERDF